MLFSHKVMSNSLQPHGLQHARLPCPSLFPGVCKNSSIKLVMPSNHLILCHPLLLPSTFPSIKVFSSESVLCIRWPEYWSFSFNISPSNEYSGLISFKIDWLDLLAVHLADPKCPSRPFPALLPLLCSNPHLFFLQKPPKLLPASSLNSLPSTTSGGHPHPLSGKQPAGHAPHPTRGICR